MQYLRKSALIIVVLLLVFVFASTSQVSADDDVAPSYGTWQYGVSYLLWYCDFDVPALEQAFLTAQSDWDSTSTPIGFEYESIYHQVVGWDYMSSDGFNGYTYPSWSGGYISHAYLWLNWTYLQNDSSNQRRNTAGHEWGHVFGLAEWYGVVDLMNPELADGDRENYYVPSQYDIAGINAIY